MPTVHWITLDLGSKRAINLKKACAALGIREIPFVAVRHSVFNLDMKNVDQKKASRLSPAQWGCISSHLNMLSIVADGDSEVALVCEDDTDFERWMGAWSFTWKQVAERIPARAGLVMLHLHPSAMFLRKDTALFYSGVPQGSPPNCLPGIPRLTGVAYLLRREAARAACRAHRDPNTRLWRMSSFFDLGASDQLLRDMADHEHLYEAHTMPILGETVDYDSSLTPSTAYLRFKTAAALAVYDGLVNPQNHGNYGSNAAAAARNVATEFATEIALTLLLAGALCVFFKTKVV
jgi:hypothetical protein